MVQTEYVEIEGYRNFKVGRHAFGFSPLAVYFTISYNIIKKLIYFFSNLIKKVETNLYRFIIQTDFF